MYKIREFNKKWLLNIEIETVKWTEETGRYLADEFEWDNFKDNKVEYLKYKEDNFSKKAKKGDKVKYPPLTTSSLRKFFGEMRQIQLSEVDRLEKILMLKPKLAYAKGKESAKTKLIEFERVAQSMLDGLISDFNDGTFEKFIKIMEAIVAYHKAFGGKDSSK